MRSLISSRRCITSVFSYVSRGRAVLFARHQLVRRTTFTGAFVVVVAGIVAVHGIDGLFMCSVMAGTILVVLGASGMG